MGPDAKAALNDISPLMYDKNKRVMAEAALANYKISEDPEKSLAVLNDLLRSRTYRVKAVECLGAMGQGADSAVPGLIAMLSEDDEVIVETAVLALKGVGPGAAKAVAPLRALQGHKDFLIAKAADEALEAINSKE